jgi:hypothetical protein
MQDFGGHLDAYNDSELYQTARTAGLPVHPAMPREFIISALLGLVEPEEHVPTNPPLPHPIDSWRRGLMYFILAYWSKLSNQLACPAQELAPYATDPEKKIPENIACFTCTDQKVIACLVDNKKREQLISLRRKE